MPALTPIEIEALSLSLRVSVVAVAASLPFGIADRLATRQVSFSRAWPG